MKNLSQLNKLIQFTIFFSVIIFNVSPINAAEDIWKKKENKNENNNQIENEEINIKSPILSTEKITEETNINEIQLEQNEQSIVGLFDPEENNFELSMWSNSDGEDIKRVFKRINKLKLSKFSEDLLFKILFTNAYPPNKNLSSSEFLKIKIDWLIKKIGRAHV